MKILFTSDLHSHEAAFKAFAEQVKNYDAGVITGDMSDEYLPDSEIMRLLKIGPDDLLDELSSEEDSPMKVWQDSVANKKMNEALIYRAIELQDILDSAHVPIFIVMGNHDRYDWIDTEFVKNVHMRKIEFGEFNFVGYKYTSMGRSIEDGSQDVRHLCKLVDSSTIMISHSPPCGILDTDGKEDHMGFKPLRKLHRFYLHLFGHVHGATGQLGRYINGSFPKSMSFCEVDTLTKKMKLVGGI